MITMTLQEDKESLSKYYLSYPKPSINIIVEWGNIQSKLDGQLYRDSSQSDFTNYSLTWY